MQQPERREYQSEFARKYVAEGRAEAVLTVLDARGISVSDEERGRILSCKDLEQLKQWLLRAVTVTSANELFD